MHTPDIALGIAVSTFLSSVSPEDNQEARQTKLAEFPGQYVPNATHFSDDLTRSLMFFDSIYAGIDALSSEVSAETTAAWRAARAFRADRRV